MANPEHLAILKQGVEVWNNWQRKAVKITPDFGHVDLSEADLSGLDLAGMFFDRVNFHAVKLIGANLRKASLRGAFLNKSDLRNADLDGAILREAYLQDADIRGASLCDIDMHSANLSEADLRLSILHGADFSAADLSGADLSGADLEGADLGGANLNAARLVKTNLRGANLAGCSIYGISAWDVNLEGTKQTNLIISHEPTITVDSLEVAQFIYLLINNKKIREVIEAITSKTVLILGRFTDERKQVLEAIKEELHLRDYVPILFDFDKPASRDITETVTILARMSRFIIADLTDPKSIPQELQAIVPDLPSVPVQPILLSSQREYGMFEHFTRYPWVLPIVRYDQLNDLLASIPNKIIAPAEAKAKELQKK